ncbi:MAG: S-layer homology domain-containing protein, partial [Clostridiales bacterium]|nr:S-layer homology domain-containing protein [Clostridiales bacterium]
AGGRWFTDVSEDAYYNHAVSWAAANGVVSGYGDGRFGPEEDITREQMAAILLNYELCMDRIPNDVLADRHYSDWDEISDWAKNAVNRLTMQDMIAGKPGNLFDPQGKATRAEFAAILERYVNAVY